MAGYLLYLGTPLLFVVGILVVLFYISWVVITSKCNECRTRNQKNKAFCIKCGANLTRQAGFDESDIFTRSALLLSFLIPFIGIYMYIAYKGLYPSRSRYLFLTGFGGFAIIPMNVMGGFFFLYGGWWYFLFFFYW